MIIPNGGPSVNASDFGDDDSGQGQQSIINVILDGEIIETIISGRQGARRTNRAALGGATPL